MGTPYFPKADKSKQKTSKVVSATAASRTYTLAHFGAIQYTVAKTVVTVGSMAAYVFSPLTSSLLEFGGINCASGKKALIWGIDEGNDTKKKRVCTVYSK